MQTGKLVFYVGLVVLAGIGFYLGTSWRGQRQPEVIQQGIEYPPSPLIVDSDFPDAIVVDADSVYTTADLIGDSGAVVMFLEVGCPPCSLMALNWSEYLRAGEVPASVHVFGISSMRREIVADWRERLNINFPIYSDSTRFYDLQFGLNDFPQRIEVGPSHMIRYHTYDASEKPDAERLRALADK